MCSVSLLLGDYVAADWKWEEYPIFNPDTEVTFEVLEKDIFNEVCNHALVQVVQQLFTCASQDNLSTALGLYSVSGSHAYYGYSSLNLKAGDTLVVSTAAGNIGIIGKCGGSRCAHCALYVKIRSTYQSCTVPTLFEPYSYCGHVLHCH